jgi:hypothetical protein
MLCSACTLAPAVVLLSSESVWAVTLVTAEFDAAVTLVSKRRYVLTTVLGAEPLIRAKSRH